MASQSAYQFDAYISHNSEDREWVDAWLLPRLEEAGLRVYVDYRDSVSGAPRLQNVERAVKGSLRTVAVVTPAWLASEWNAFEDVLVRSLDPAALRRRLIPIKLKECDLPESLAALETIDLTAERRWEQGVQRLRRDLEDLIPVAAPWQQDHSEPLWARWRRWLRRYRREVRWGVVAAVLLWLVASMSLGLWPFQDRLVWSAEPLEAPKALVIHNTGASLMVGGANTGEGCNIRPRGLWYRAEPAGVWQESSTDNLLCIEQRNPPALSDIRALASLPEDPLTVFALTSHSGVLVSRDAGATFEKHPAGVPETGLRNLPQLLEVASETPFVLWIAGQEQGLYVYREGGWTQVDGRGTGGCEGLPGLTVRSLLVQEQRILIGSDRDGLWLSEDGGNTCRRVFDADGRYEFKGLWNVSSGSHLRTLALVYDTAVEPGDPQGTWKLLDLCPRPESCSPTQWTAEPNPVWGKTAVVKSVHVQKGADGFQWFLVAELGQVWTGDLTGQQPERLPSIRRCVVSCDADFASAAAGPPYLLAGNPSYGVSRVYRLVEGPWMRWLWP